MTFVAGQAGGTTVTTYRFPWRTRFIVAFPMLPHNVLLRCIQKDNGSNEAYQCVTFSLCNLSLQLL